MSITFEVIDLNCQAEDISFFVPQVQLTGKSTTSFATLYGWSEFGTPSTPPKKYRTITVTGFSLRVGFTAESTPQQCAGAKYVFSGVGQVDLKGHLIQRYNKNFFAQCSKQYWPPEPLQLLPGSIHSDPNFPNTFVGYCWPTDLKSCSTCDPDETDWAFLGNYSSTTQAFDLFGFLSTNTPVVTSTTYAVNDVFHGITSVHTDEFSAVLFGTDSDNYTVTVGSTTYTGRAAVTDPGTINFPAEFLRLGGGTFLLGQYINFTDTNNFSAVLTDEYTDALALANATVVIGTGKTAQNTPRTTGFTSITTSVVYTLAFDNLLSGQDYTATVDLWDLSEDNFGTVSVHTLKTYAFTASGATHTIVDVVPTPAAFHTITVQKPTVAFAT